MSDRLKSFFGYNPATRAEAEEALRDVTKNDTSNETPSETAGDTAVESYDEKVDATTDAPVEDQVGAPSLDERLSTFDLNAVFARVVEEGKAKGFEPGTPEFDKLLKETVESELGDGINVNVSFLGAFPEGFGPFDDIFGSPDLDSLFGSSEFSSFPFDTPPGGTFGTSTDPFSLSGSIGGDEVCKFCEALKAEIEAAEAFEQERRVVTQDLSYAAADVTDVFTIDEEAGRDFAEALLNISRLATSTYGN